jgi:hypothetical protein
MKSVNLKFLEPSGQLQSSNGTALPFFTYSPVEMWWHTVTHRRGSEGGNWRMEWVASTLHTTSEHVYPALLPLMRTPRLPAVDWTDAPLLYKRTRPFRRRKKSVFCVCAITLHTQSTTTLDVLTVVLLYRRDRDLHRGPSTDRIVISFPSNPPHPRFPGCLLV